MKQLVDVSPTFFQLSDVTIKKNHKNFCYIIILSKQLDRFNSLFPLGTPERKQSGADLKDECLELTLFL